MPLLDSTVGLIYKIQASDNDARETVSGFRSHVEKETSRIEDAGNDAFTEFGKSIGLSDGQLDKLASSLPIVGAATAALGTVIAVTATAIVSATRTLYEFTSQAATAGTEIANFQKLTGLTAESISSIKVASESAGTSLEEFEEVWESFIELLIEGGKGADDAKDKLMSAGIDPQKGFNDLEGSVQKAFNAIRNAQTQAEKSAIAMNVFGESGLNMVKVADEMTGGFEAYRQKLKELGLTMDADGIKKAKEFDRETKQVGMQIQGLKNIIGMEFMPVFLDMAKATSGWLKDNKEGIKTWASELSTKMTGVIAYWKELNQWVARYKLLSENPPEGSWSEYFRKIDEFILGKEGVKTLQKNPLANPTWQVGKDVGENLLNKGQQSKAPDIVGNSTDFVYDATKLTNPEKEREEKEKAARETLAAQERINKAIAEGNRAAFEKEQAALIESYKKRGITAETFNNEFLKTEQLFRAKMLEIIGNDFAQKRANEKNATAKKALALEEQNERDKIITESMNREKEAEKLITETVKQETEKQTKSVEESVKNRIALYQKNTDVAIKESARQLAQMLISEKEHIENVQTLKKKALIFEIQELEKLEKTKQNIQRIEELTAEGKALFNDNEKEWREYYDKLLKLEIEKRGKILELEQRISEEKERQQRALDIAPRPGYDEFGEESTEAPEPSFFSTWRSFIEEMTKDSIGISDIMTGVSEMFTQSFQNMTDALGSAIAGWALYGDSVGKALKKALAAELAHIAGVATVKALYATALGFMRLAEWDFVGAGHAFLSAGLWAALAGGTALAARALSGNQRTESAFSGATSTNTATSTASSGGNSNGATAYSSFGNNVTTVENDLNRASETTSRIKIELDQGLIARVIREDANNNGPIRQTLISVHQGS